MQEKIGFKKRIKHFVLLVFQYMGGFYLTHWLQRDKITILMLHGVMKEGSGETWAPLRNQTTPDDLEKGLRILQKHYRFITLTDAVAILQGKKAPVSNALVFTFDDGYRNNVDCALPILKRYGVVPTIFVATGHLDKKIPFWVDRIDYALQFIPAPSYTIKFGSFEHVFNTSSRDALTSSYRAFLAKCKYEFKNDLDMLHALDKMAEEMEAVSGKSIADLGDVDVWSGLVGWNELVPELEAKKLEIGSHTVNHVRVSRVHPDIAKIELEESKSRVESELGNRCTSFCYPNGDNDEESARLVASCGYDCAVTTEPGLCVKGDDMFRLKRFAFPKVDREVSFLFELTGVRQMPDRFY